MKKMQVQNAKGEVRIIAGLWRGRKLPVLNAEGLRPTGDRVKETLFNWLMPYIVDSYCLDCFAGSGSLGFEALSRQAKQVTFLELDKTVANQLKKNLQTLKTTNEQAQVINQNSLEFLKQAQNQPHFALAEIRGGSIRNAIPREAAATICFNHDVESVKSAVKNFEVLLKEELAIAEPNLTLTAEQVENPQQTFTLETTQKVINLLNVLPNGVIRNSDVIKNVVETSLSIGVLKTLEDKIKGTILIRSLIESGKEYVEETLTSLAELTGATVEFSGSYPGWKPVNDTAILALMKKHYAEVLGKEPVIKVIHAGLECGLLKEHYPNIDMISVGPTIRNAHSPDEKVQISTVQTYWELLTKVLADIK